MKNLLASGRSLHAFTALLASLTLMAAFSAESAEMLIARGSVWRYLDNGSDQGTTWRAPGYDDSAWAAGPAQLGFGDGDEVTVVSGGPDPMLKNVTTYFRRSFSAALTNVPSLTLRVLRDDGAVVYINGVEVFRSNLPSGPIAYDTLASLAVGGAEESTQFVTASISPAVLAVGANTVAVEIHQNSPLSSDLSFDLELEVGGGSDPVNVPPSVTITAPQENSIFSGPTNILLRARATDVDGSVTRVEFFAGTNLLGATPGLLGGTNAFYNFVWSNAPATGVQVLRAQAFDDDGAPALSPPVTIAVVPYPVPPLVTAQVIDSEGSEAASDPAMFRVSRSPVRNTDLTVYYSVEGSARNGIDYEIVGAGAGSAVIPAGAGSVDVTFRPIDDDAFEATEVIWFELKPSAPGTIPVFPPPADGYRISTNNARLTAAIVDNESNRPPVVQITAPVAGATFPAGSHITIIADALDADGGVTRVHFFANNTALGEVRLANHPPDDYALTWSNVAVGEYSLTARAMDGNGNYADSQPVPIRVVADGQGTNVIFVLGGSVWRYSATGQAPEGNWRAAGYDDAFWPSGPAQLGYGDGDEATVISFGPFPDNRSITTYFRHLFQVNDAGTVSSLVLRLLEDDGAVVYLNGVEVLRDNLPGGTIEHNTLALQAVEDRTVEAQISPSLLVNGVNVLAVEMHQVTTTSADLSFDLQLSGTRVRNEESPIINVFAADPFASEGSLITPAFDSGRFTFTRTGPLSNELTVVFAVGGTALNGTDYNFVSNRIRFGPGVAGTSVLIVPRPDELFEPTESVIVTLEEPLCAAMVPRPPGCYRIGTSNQATVFIANNSLTNVLPIISVQAIDPIGVEIPANTDPLPNPAVFRITRNGPTNDALNIGYSMAGTAINGVDYQFVPGQLELSAGLRFKDVTIDVLSDNLVEGNESVVFRLEPPACATIDPPPPGCYRLAISNSATATILDAPTGTNLPPTISVISPTNGAVFAAPAMIVIEAEASDSDGLVSRVDFFAGTNRLGQDTTAPYLVVWSNVVAGTYSLRVVATDDDGAMALAPPVTITVTGTNPPVVPPTIISHPQSQTVLAGSDVSFTVVATGTPPLGYRWRRNSVIISNANSPTLTLFNVQSNQAGFYSVIVTNAGGMRLSSNALLTVISEPQPTNPPVVLVANGSVWKYLDNGSDQGGAWRSNGFNDETWASGPAQLGYGDGDEATVVGFGPDPANRYITTYFRRSFGLTNAVNFSVLRGRLLQDDGGAVYINGVEVFRSNLPAGPLSYNTLATSVSPDNQIVEFSAPASLLVNGVNVVAVEMHQVNAASSDLSFDLQLVGERQSGPAELPVINVVATDPDAAESGLLAAVFPGTFTFHRSGPTNDALSVFFTVSGTASNGLDYARVTNTVHFARGELEKRVVIYPTSDNLSEGTESVIFRLVPPACATVLPPPPGCYRVGAANQATVFIHDATPIDPTNAPPRVAITHPGDGSLFTAPTDIRIEAVTTDPDGYANRVEFFANAVRIGEARIDFIQAPDPGTPIEFQFVWRNAPVGQHRLTARTVDNEGAAAISQPVSITVREETSGDRELHVVGVYSGTTSAGTTSRSHEVGRTAIFVDRPGKAVTLFLSAYEPVDWMLSASAGTIIERVFVSGYYPPTVQGVGVGVEVVQLWYNSYLGYTLDSGRFYRIAPRVRELTGMEMASFHGDYQGPYPAPFIINEIQADPRLHSSYPVPTPLSQLPDVRFAISFQSGAGIATRAYTLGGPSDGGPLLSGNDRAVRDNAGRYYALSGDGIVQINTNGIVRSISVDLGSPELSWPMGIAYDSLRDRVLIVSLGGEGYLYAYSPAQDAWSVVSSMNNVDLASLVYHPGEDALYGMGVSQPDDSHTTLYRLNPDGTSVTTRRLPLYPWGIHMGSSELVSVGQHIVLLLRPSFFGDQGDHHHESRMYLIQPTTGDVWLTYRDIPVTDSDFDGVPNERDLCPNTPRGTVVDAHGCPISVADGDGDGVADNQDRCPGTPSGQTVNSSGCSIAQLAPCEGPWRNHAQYVDSVIRNAWAFFRQGLISAEERRAVIQEATTSDCGRDLSRTEPAYVHLVPLAPNECRNGVLVVISGDKTANYILECSIDTIHWFPVPMAGSAPVGVEIACSGAEGNGANFYRVRLQR